MGRTDFRAAAARRLSEDRELPPAIVSLLSPDTGRRTKGVRVLDCADIDPNPRQPRVEFDEQSLEELAASIREHGVLQPILVRPAGDGRYELIAGERRWRASRLADRATIPALVEEIDDETALEISVIENLQREDLSPLEEAMIYRRMIRDHGYSIRKLAEKLGKDKGYIENRVRLADAPAELRDLVSVRKDTLSHAYELMKVEDPARRRQLAERVARNELSLVRLREEIEGHPPRERSASPAGAAGRPRGRVRTASAPGTVPVDAPDGEAWAERGAAASGSLREDALVTAKQRLNAAVEGLIEVIRSPEVQQELGATDRANLAKYLVIAKLRLENAISVVRSGEG